MINSMQMLLSLWILSYKSQHESLSSFKQRKPASTDTLSNFKMSRMQTQCSLLCRLASELLKNTQRPSPYDFADVKWFLDILLIGVQHYIQLLQTVES